MKHEICIVTGAPGAGKTTVLQSFLKLDTPYIAFDIDWLAEPATELAGKSINFDSTIWKPYSHMWFAVLDALYKNNKTPVLFAPFDKDDLERYDVPAWCEGVEWLLLDCDDATRTKRLAERDWTAEQLADAMADAAKLRATIPNTLDTTVHNPEQAASQIATWLKSLE